jgi:DNA recombination protein RmuC
VADQAKKLAGKQYWAQFEGSPEFVVMFIPGDQFVDAALERRPDLLDMAAEHGVLLASPSTLIGLLRAVAVGWREKALSDSARELFELGRELHERASVAMGHAAEVGNAIRMAAERYNRFVGSVDHRLMPTLRKFEEKGAKSSRELEGLSEVEGSVREVKSLPERGGGEGPEADESALYGESAG